MNDYREVQSYLSHSKKKSSAGMPTNLKQESSNIKRASERAKFMNELQQIWDRLTVLDQQIVRLRRNNLRTTELKEQDLPDGGKEIVTNYKRGGSHSAVTELTKAWDKYLKEEKQLSKKAYNLINMGKNDPMFTRLEQEKMKVLIKNADDVDTNKIRDLLEFIFSHSELDNYLAHASDAFNRKRKDIPVSGMPTSDAAKAGYKGTTGTINNHVSIAEKTASRRVYDPNTATFKDSGTSITDKMVQNADRQQIINRATAMNNITNKVVHSVQNNNQLGQLKELKSMIAAYNQKYGAKLRLKERSVVSAGWDNKLFTMEVTG